MAWASFGATSSSAAFERLAVGAVQVGDLGVAGLVRGHQHEGIVGGGVAIDGDAVEGAIGQLA